jgi:riboflavin synthase
MFTGIIEGLGTVTRVRPSQMGKQLTIEAGFELTGTKIGDSIAVNGACLTAVALDRRRFTVDAAPETLKMTTCGQTRVGERVNLERAMRLGERLDGHLVSGHIDGIGTILDKKSLGNAVIVTVAVDAKLAHFMIEKGSVALDGISLTINVCGKDFFEVSIIPHTAKETTIGFKKPNDPVNIETDMIGKYVKRFTDGSNDHSELKKPDAGGIDMAFLSKTGFL